MYIHPLKVWDRYSPEMFLPHAVYGGRMGHPSSRAGDAAAVSADGQQVPLWGRSGLHRSLGQRL